MDPVQKKAYHSAYYRAHKEKWESAAKRNSGEQREAFLARRRDARKANAQNINEKARAARAADPARFAEYAKTESRKRPEKMRARVSRWVKAHPEARLAFTQNYRAKKRANGGKVSGRDWLVILDQFNNACAYCLRSDIPMCMDHVHPVSRGGWHTVSNLVPACKACNSTKGAQGILSMLKTAISWT